MDQNTVNRRFTYHPPTQDQLIKYEMIRAAGKHFAEIVLFCTPNSVDQTAAIRKVREAVMTANAAIATEPEVQIGIANAVDECETPQHPPSYFRSNRFENRTIFPKE